MSNDRSNRTPGKGFGIALAVLAGLLAAIFHRSFISGVVLFSNDGPLGNLMAEALRLPGAFTGFWSDLNWIGIYGGSASPCVTYGLLWILGPIGFAKFYGPITLLILGLSAWFFLRRIGLRPGLATLGGIAAALNMNYFSNTCWGLGTRSLTLAAIFLSLSAVVGGAKGLRSWIGAVLAGLFVGVAIMEGADNGAIFSLYVAAFVLFHQIVVERQPGCWLRGAGQLLVVVVAAFVMAAQPLSYLADAAISGTAEPSTNAQGGASQTEHWNNATRWSLPKIEILRTLVPGLFGYRMETPDGGNYWGAVGQAPGDPQSRHSGSGEYAGVMVILLAVYAMAEAGRRSGGGLNPKERKWVWFWTGSAVASFLFAFGRHAPFYQIIYSLPYFSSIRNPIKFMHPFHMSALALMGYGMLAMDRRFLRPVVATSTTRDGLVEGWWKRAGAFDKNWTRGCGIALALSAVGWLIYASSENDLVSFLRTAGFPPELGLTIAKFSVREAGVFVIVFAAAAGVLWLIQAGVFAGKRSVVGIGLLGVVLVIDLTRANLPWIKYDNYKEKYADNALFDLLRNRSFEHRVAARIHPNLGSYLAPQQAQREWGTLSYEWLSFPFQFWNIQSLDYVQMPRAPLLDSSYLVKFLPSQNDISPCRRLWQLTNTRYILGFADSKDFLNQGADPAGRSFRIHTLFGLGQDPASGTILVKTNMEGPLALIEFTGALPRAKLYSQWQTSTNDQAILQQLAAPSFDPAKLALVSADPAAPASSTSPTNAPEGTVEWVSYAPKKIVLKTTASSKSLLLLNDRHDPDWVVRMDGNRVPLLRCNYIMRGAMIEAGNHEVVFSYEPKMTGLHVSLAAIVLGVALCGFLALSPEINAEENKSPGAAPVTEPPPGAPNQPSAPAKPQEQQQPQASAKKRRP